LGADIRDVAEAVGRLLRDAWLAGRPAGLVRQAIAVLELAVADLEGKLAGLPLHRLWGQTTGPTRAYASGGWRHLPIDELVQLARRWADQGFGAVKIQVGLSPDEDDRRLAEVRAAVGPDVAIMLDANQRLPLDAATEWATKLAPHRPTWLEEPLAAELHDELAVLRAATSIPIAAGESESEPTELDDLLARDAVDVLQPDIWRAGLTPTRAAIASGASRGVIPAPHLAHEIGAHVLSGSAAMGWLEYVDWFDDWWTSPRIPDGGCITPARVPGHGLELKPGWLDAHAI
jgi:L-alanine-DL-glutamate epimerase-like enolase superfamily enzyme